ncbi:3-hydroxyacyl-dehydrogenase [Micractinium conductrix]|uniref:3-hydroxyacyl-dehydrogenase n=1 Tax=Micractinium conductrix TaxID=554055 RepID=A0A2P6VRG2_9CHLO|nr:3-hydroxyacyl-dehydrogenase [Micractinium conductrix]|eukprot:PSC76660.1 3-hydroxyacyl-dehydrogenase [Micractinium conductrix]
MSSKSAFEKRERAEEEVWMRQEERLHMLKRLEGLVEKGKLDASVLEEVRKATSPDVHHATGVEVSPGVFKDVPGETVRRAEHVYAHDPTKRAPLAPSEVERMKTGVHVDMGPSKWNPGGGDTSIFSLSQSLAEETPAGKNLPPHEVARLARLQKAAGAVEVPSVFGLKLSAGTPGRTFFWGGLLAIWGTAALVAASARGLGPTGRGAAPAGGEVSAHELGTLSAMGQRLANVFLPWKERLAARPRSATEEHSEFVRRLKEGMVASPGPGAKA